MAHASPTVATRSPLTCDTVDDIDEHGAKTTLISKAPYLKAQTLLAKGDCWHGGGLFSSNKELWLNDGYGPWCLRTTRASSARRCIRGMSTMAGMPRVFTTCACWSAGMQGDHAR
jgi:hypothetical protein